MRTGIPQLGHYCSTNRYLCTYSSANGCTYTPVCMPVAKIAEHMFVVVERVGTSTAMYMGVQAQQ